MAEDYDSESSSPDREGDRSEDGKRPEAERGKNARLYAARRRGWIREHSRDDRFLIFIGVAITLALCFLIAYWVVSSYTSKPVYPPVPISELFHAPAEEVSPGVVRVKYEFPYDGKHYSVREACPQTGDWERVSRTYQIDSQGIMVGGKATYRPFFEPGYMVVEADAALVTGSQITIIFSSIYDYREGDYFRLNLTASRGKDWPATAQLSRFEDGTRRESTRLAELPSLIVRRDPPLFHRVRLELSGGKLSAWFAPPGGKLQKICQMEVEDDMGAGKVTLTGEFSHTAYDNVLVTGRPHPQFVDKRTQLYHLLNMGAEEKSPRPESAPETREE